MSDGVATTETSGASEQPLFHYCSIDSFAKIVTGRSVRLSSLTQSNDAMEGRLVSHLLLDRAQRKGLKRAQAEELASMFDAHTGSIGCFGFCLSEDGDLLSQWRGYGDDGHGVSIGFSRKYLSALCHKENLSEPSKDFLLLCSAIYRQEDQIAKIDDALNRGKGLIDDGALDPMVPFGAAVTLLGRSSGDVAAWNHETMKKRSQLISVLSPLLLDLFRMKSDAFDEEKEWRLVTAPVFFERDPRRYEFIARRGSLVPFRTLNLRHIDGERPIERVYLGPRNTTPVPVIRQCLAGAGFPDVEIVVSRATYR